MAIPLLWTAVQLWTFAVHLSIDPQFLQPSHRLCPNNKHPEISDKCTAASVSISPKNQRNPLGKMWMCGVSA